MINSAASATDGQELLLALRDTDTNTDMRDIERNEGNAMIVFHIRHPTRGFLLWN